MISHLKSIPNLNRFFEVCEIPHYVCRDAQEDSKIEPAEMAEYSAIEQAVCIWWLINNKSLYWKVEHLQNGFETLKIGKFSKSMLERHPQIYPSFHDIQLDLPENNQAAPSSDSPAPHNITVEYAERQISKRERNFLQYLSTHIYKSEFVDKLAFATSLDAATLLTIQAIYHDPKRAEWTNQGYIAYHNLVTWYASVSHTQTEKLCKLQDVYYAMDYGKDFEMFVVDSKFELPKMKKGGNKKQTPAMGVAALSRQNPFSPNSQVSSGPNGENTVGKGILNANVNQSVNSGEEQLIAFGEATIENVGMGTDKNPRTVTFELSQAQSGANSSTPTSPPLVSSDCLSR